MKKSEDSKAILCMIIVLSMLMSSSFSQGNIEKIDDKGLVSRASNDNIMPMYQNPIEDDQPHLSYTPVITDSGSGNDISIHDELSVYHSDSLSILGGGIDDYTIDLPSGYSAKNLNYNMTINTQTEDIDYQTVSNKNDESLRVGIPMLAFKFSITWDYVIFHGARMDWRIKGGGYGTDVMKFYIVKAQVSGNPDLSVEYAHELNGPFSSGNLIATGYSYFDFNDTILPSGDYFVVAEKTADDGLDTTGFIWRSQQGGDYSSDTYYYDGSWHQNGARGVVFSMQIQVCDSVGNTEIADPTDIALQDNGVPVTSLTQSISSVGQHNLSSDTTVDIDLNNSYTFDKAVLASSQYQISNSSFLDYTVEWDMIFQTTEVTYSPYSNPSRFQRIYLPTDWDKTSPNFLQGGTIPITVQQTSYGFSIDMEQFLSGGTYEDQTITFECTSPNYLYDLSLNDDTYNLGYWTADGVNSTGYEGSTVIADIMIKDYLDNDVTLGDANFTLYDPDGNLLPLKSGLPANILYTDTSSYSILDVVQESAGLYTVSVVLDPSVYGSDMEGFWTAAAMWTNGTEVGYFSLRISVTKSTTASFRWEVTDGGSWSSNTSASLTRINEETIRVQVLYNNISDPFFVGEGTPITAAPVVFTTSWGTTDFLSYVGPYYEVYISINSIEGFQTISLNATGDLLQSYSIEIDVNVLHQFDAVALGSSFDAYYEDNYTILEFRVRDITNGSIAIIPDTTVFYLDDVLLTEIDDYNVIIDSDSIDLYLFVDSDHLHLFPGSYDIKMEATKDNFVVDYGNDTVSIETSLEINQVTTQLQIIESDESVFQGNVTTITFLFVDTIHSENIKGAIIDVSFDVDDASLVDIYEMNGLYTVTVRVHEPQETSIHIQITATKTGYVSVVDYPVPEVVINVPGEPGGIPFYIFIIIGIFGSALIILPTVLLIRRKLTSTKRGEKALFSRIYGLYESVLSITKLIAVHKSTGLPVYEMDLGSEISLDPSLITGFLTAISSMGIELRGDRAGAVKRLQYKNFYVTGSDSGNFTIYTFSETELNEEIEERLTVVSDWFAKMFNQIGDDWDGSTEVFRVNLQGITEKIMKEIHLWIFYPFIISPYKTSQVEELTGLKKTLAKFIIDNETVTISKIFDTLDSVKIEKGLPIIFEFIEEGILIPVFDAYKIATVRF